MNFVPTKEGKKVEVLCGKKKACNYERSGGEGEGGSAAGEEGGNGGVGEG